MAIMLDVAAPEGVSVQPVEPAPPSRAYRTTVIVSVIVGLVVLGVFVAGAIFLFGPDASAAGSCGGG
jgi:hypothetical protein